MVRIFFFLQNSKINSNTQNFDKSKLSATQNVEAIDVNNAPLDKDNEESVDDNSCNSNECNKIPDQELSNKIANDNSKTIAGLIRITRITLIALITQEQSNMLAEMIQIMKMCKNHQVQNRCIQ